MIVTYLMLAVVTVGQTPGPGPGFGAPPKPGPPERFTVSAPGQGWALSFEAPPLSSFSGQSMGGNYQFRGNWPGGFSVAVSSRPAPAGGEKQHDNAYDHYWPLAQRGPTIDPASLKVDKSGPRFVKVSYKTRVRPLVAGAPGPAPTKPVPADIPHVNYYFAVNGHWVDVHLSRSPAGLDDQEQIARFERSLTYREGSK